MRRRWLLLLALAACRGGDRNAGAAAPGGPRVTGVALVDSAGAAPASPSGALRRVAVQVGARRDTVPAVLTQMPPGVLGDTAVVGFTYAGDSVSGVFVYSVAARTVARRPLGLGDLTSPFAAPSFAPDGQSFLYIADDTTADSVRPTLRRWPGLDVVASGPGVPAGESEVASYTTEWHGPDTAVATFSFGECPAPLVLRTSFVLSSETMRSDTVIALGQGAAAPHWWPWSDSVPVPVPGLKAWLVARTSGPSLGPSFVLQIRGGGAVEFADSISDVDFQLPGTSCPGIPVGGPQDAYDAFLRSVADTQWSPEFQVTAPNVREDYGTPPHVVRYQWSVGERILRKAIAWNFRTRRFDVLAPAPEDTTSAE